MCLPVFNPLESSCCKLKFNGKLVLLVTLLVIVLPINLLKSKLLNFDKIKDFQRFIIAPKVTLPSNLKLLLRKILF